MSAGQTSLFDVTTVGDQEVCRIPRTPRPQHVHANSIAAYRQGKKALSERATLILAEIRTNGPGTDRQIAARMGFAHRSLVQPRITELREAGLLIEIGNVICGETGKTVRQVDVPDYEAEGAV